MALAAAAAAAAAAGMRPHAGTIGLTTLRTIGVTAEKSVCVLAGMLRERYK